MDNKNNIKEKDKKQNKDNKDPLDGVNIVKESGNKGLFQSLFFTMKTYFKEARKLPLKKLPSEGKYLLVFVAVFMIAMFIIYIKLIQGGGPM